MKQSYNRKWLIAGASVLIVTALLFTLYFFRIESISEYISNLYLSDAAINISDSVDMQFEGDAELLSSLTALAADADNPEAAAASMDFAVGSRGFEKIGVALYSTGMAHMSGGSSFDCSSQDYFTAAKAGMWGGVGGCFVGLYPNGGGVTTVCAVPYSENGREVGFVFGERNVDVLAELVDPALFGGEGYGLIVDRDGSLLYSGDIENNAFTGSDAEREYYTSKLRSEISPQIAENYRTGGTWMSDSDGRVLVFAPLDVAEWYAVIVIPDAVVGAQTHWLLVFSILLSIVTLTIFAGFCAVLLIDRKRRHDEMIDAMLTDALTGLYNRQGYVGRIHAILNASTSDETYAVVDLGINRFENFNALYGYQRGDSTLYQIGALLLGECQDEKECCARLDGTRFSLLLRFDTVSNLERRLNEVNLMISMTLPSAALRINYGVFLAVDKKAPPEMLVDRAYAARTLAKDKRNGAISYYDYEVHDAAIEDAEMLATMETAIASRQFMVLYQPKYRCDERKLTGAEALVRWALPEGATKPPDRYIHLFEEHGLIVKLDLFVLDDVCRMLRAQFDAGLNPQPVSVNLSRVHLYDRETVKKLTAILNKWSISPDYIEIEMTESIMTGNMELFMEFVEELHQAGLRVAMDDFGSGYSSLNMLKRVQIDVIKLDKLFLDEFDNKERARKVITGILDMANSLGVETVAEGVETVDQLLFLRRSGCTLAQGYYFSRPIPETEYNTLLETEYGSVYGPD